MCVALNQAHRQFSAAKHRGAGERGGRVGKGRLQEAFLTRYCS